MKKPKLSTTLNEELKNHSKKDKKRRIIANSLVVLTVVVFVILAKVFIFKGDIKISDDNKKAPSEKIESQPEVKDETKPAEVPATTPAAPTAPATPAPETGYTTYVVKEGDTLSSIANANNMTSKQLMDYNGIVDPTLMPGQNIKIPK
ncbi:MAG: LysM peptidoglycan-binding domain-containing protein [Patescibacteria group bacterium]|mgnify:FL=1